MTTLNDICTQLKAKGWDANQTKRAEYVVEYFDNKSIDQLKTLDVDQLINHLETKKNLKGSTINRYLSALSKILTYAQNRQIIKDTPHIEWCPENNARERYVSKQEEAKLIASCNKLGYSNYGQFFCFLMDTGLNKYL